jgi:hypothetical protein
MPCIKILLQRPTLIIFQKIQTPHTPTHGEREREEKGNHFVVGRMQRPRRAMPWRTWRLHLSLPFLSPLSGDACFFLSWLWEHDSLCLVLLCCSFAETSSRLQPPYIDAEETDFGRIHLLVLAQRLQQRH